MSDLSKYQQRLHNYFEQHLPSVNASGTQLEQLSSESLVLSVPLDKNSNEYGKIYGGSLYQLAMTACWSALYLQCAEKIKQPNIVTRDGHIRYRQPCSGSLIKATCRLPDARQWDGFFAHYEKTGKTSLTLTSKIMNGNDVAAYFDGVFVLLDENQ